MPVADQFFFCRCAFGHLRKPSKPHFVPRRFVLSLAAIVIAFLFLITGFQAFSQHQPTNNVAWPDTDRFAEKQKTLDYLSKSVDAFYNADYVTYCNH
jgi:cell division protein FtsB